MKDIPAHEPDETHRETGEGKLREVDLDFEGLLPNGVEGIARDHLCLVLAAVPGNTNNLWQICTRFNSDLFASSSFTCKQTHLNLDEGRGAVVLLAERRDLGRRIFRRVRRRHVHRRRRSTSPRERGSRNASNRA